MGAIRVFLLLALGSLVTGFGGGCLAFDSFVLYSIINGLPTKWLYMYTLFQLISIWLMSLGLCLIFILMCLLSNLS